jgi:hypothetical protein
MADTMLATYLPLPTMTFLGDVPLVAPEQPAWVTALVVVVVPLVLSALASAIASAVNEVIRQRDAAEQPVSASFRIFAAVLNAVALNLDKTREQKAIASGAAQPRPAAEKETP